MNISAGQSSKKEHLGNGSRTACNRKTSGIGCNGLESFKWWVEKHPDACCEKCKSVFIKKIKP